GEQRHECRNGPSAIVPDIGQEPEQGTQFALPRRCRFRRSRNNGHFGGFDHVRRGSLDDVHGHLYLQAREALHQTAGISMRRGAHSPWQADVNALVDALWPYGIFPTILITHISRGYG